MAAFALENEWDAIVAYDREPVSAPFLSTGEELIERQRGNRRRAETLAEVILHRGPAPARWERALRGIAGSREPRAFSVAYHRTHLSDVWVSYQAIAEAAPAAFEESFRTITVPGAGFILTIHESPVLGLMYSEDRRRASSSALSAVFDHFLMLQGQRRIDEINDVLATADVGRLAPEFMVGLLRINFPERKHLTNWVEYLKRTETELLSRQAPDVPGILQGLHLT